jgi:hypothetical protein
MTDITAKITCSYKQDFGGNVLVRFAPDYAQGRNASWAAATPALELSMTMRGDVADLFEVGRPYELRFTPEDAE